MLKDMPKTEREKADMISSIVMEFHDRAMREESPRAKITFMAQKRLMQAYLEWFFHDFTPVRDMAAIDRRSQVTSDGLTDIMMITSRIVASHMIQESGGRHIPEKIVKALGNSYRDVLVREIDAAQDALNRDPDIIEMRKKSGFSVDDIYDAMREIDPELAEEIFGKS